MSITASDARRRLLTLIKQVNADQEAVEIISEKGAAYLVPEDEYRSWRETMYLLASPANAARLNASITAHRTGDTAVHDLVEPDLRRSPSPSTRDGSA